MTIIIKAMFRHQRTFVVSGKKVKSQLCYHGKLSSYHGNRAGNSLFLASRNKRIINVCKYFTRTSILVFVY